MKTIAILQTFDFKTDTFTELERHEVRATPPDRFLNDPPGVLFFGGQAYTAVPLHLRPPRVFPGGTLPDNGLRSDGPELVLELPYVLADVYDLELDQPAERLYSPAEASDLVERVRAPLDELTQALTLLAKGAAITDPLSLTPSAIHYALEHIAHPVLRELAPVPDDTPEG